MIGLVVASMIAGACILGLFWGWSMRSPEVARHWYRKMHDTPELQPLYHQACTCKLTQYDSLAKDAINLKTSADEIFQSANEIYSLALAERRAADEYYTDVLREANERAREIIKAAERQPGFTIPLCVDCSTPLPETGYGVWREVVKMGWAETTDYVCDACRGKKVRELCNADS